MINLLIFSIIVGIVASVIIVPLAMNNSETKEPVKFNRWAAMASTATLFAIIVFVLYYVTNMDRNWTSLWVALLVVTFLGVVVAGKRTESRKSSYFLRPSPSARIY